MIGALAGRVMHDLHLWHESGSLQPATSSVALTTKFADRSDAPNAQRP